MRMIQHSPTVGSHLSLQVSLLTHQDFCYADVLKAQITLTENSSVSVLNEAAEMAAS